MERRFYSTQAYLCTDWSQQKQYGRRQGVNSEDSRTTIAPSMVGSKHSILQKPQKLYRRTKGDLKNNGEARHCEKG